MINVESEERVRPNAAKSSSAKDTVEVDVIPRRRVRIATRDYKKICSILFMA
jgi:hypothetical protein